MSGTRTDGGSARPTFASSGAKTCSSPPFLYAVVTAIAIAICTDLTDSGWFGVPLGTAAGSLAWFGVMFAFSRGWIAEGD